MCLGGKHQGGSKVELTEVSKQPAHPNSRRQAAPVLDFRDEMSFISIAPTLAHPWLQDRIHVSILDLELIVIYHFITMKTATIRDLRYAFPRVEAWILDGNEIEITNRGRAIARITPVPKSAKTRLMKPDFMAQ